MKFKTGDEVIELASGKTCVVVASKDDSWKKTLDPYNRKEVFPDDHFDYIVLIKIGKNHYKGEMHVFESQLSKK